MSEKLKLNLNRHYSEPETLLFSIHGDMLTNVEKPLVRGGDVEVEVSVRPAAYGLQLGFRVKGTVAVDCDRCLGELVLPIYTEQTLRIKHGDAYCDEGDVVSIPPEQTELDLWPFIYDYIMLAIPLQHTHAEGECDQEMEDELRKYLVSCD